MLTIQSRGGSLLTERSPQLEADTICCYLDAEVSRRTARFILSNERSLAAQALLLLTRLDQALNQARADWNEDRFRRVMRARPKAVSRVRRRWNSLNPAPDTGVGQLRRRYHANLAGYLYQAPVSADTDLGK
jgi:hypothetical protein